jgi:methionine sulfoxide reductase heme-binding subunit
MNSFLSNRWLKIPVFLACLVPAGLLVWDGFTGGLGANPVEFIQHSTGDWTIRFLIITLAITPFRKLLNLPALIRYRRMLGLFAFFYICAHFATYFVLDQAMDFHSMWQDFAKRPFITMGYLGFLLMIPLALTSTKGWIRRLGGKRWTWLHRAIYVSAIAGVIHYAWLVKSDERKPIQYAVLVGLLLLARVFLWLRSRMKPTRASAPSAEPTTAESA